MNSFSSRRRSNDKTDNNIKMIIIMIFNDIKTNILMMVMIMFNVEKDEDL